MMAPISLMRQPKAGKVICGDAPTLISTLPDRSVNLCLTSPPLSPALTATGQEAPASSSGVHVLRFWLCCASASRQNTEFVVPPWERPGPLCDASSFLTT